MPRYFYLTPQVGGSSDAKASYVSSVPVVRYCLLGGVGVLCAASSRPADGPSHPRPRPEASPETLVASPLATSSRSRPQTCSASKSCWDMRF